MWGLVWKRAPFTIWYLFLYCLSDAAITDMQRGDMDRGDMDRGDMDRGDMDRGDMDRGDIDRGEDACLAMTDARTLSQPACVLYDSAEHIERAVDVNVT